MKIWRAKRASLSLDSCGSKTVLFLQRTKPPVMQRSLRFGAKAEGWQVPSASLVAGERGRRGKLWNLLLQDVADAEGLHGLVETC